MKKIVVGIGFILALAVIFFYLMPAFAGRIAVGPTLSLGLFEIRWYGLLVAAGVLAGYLVARKNCWRFGIDRQEVDNLVFWLVIVGVVGARAYFVLSDFGYFTRNPGEIYKIWHGGMSIFGSIIFGLMFLFFYARNKAYSTKHLLDLVALSVPLGHALGRFANFFNQEAFGGPTDLPWRMFVRPERRPAGFSETEFFHPTFLYEAVFNVCLFGLLFFLKNKLKPGQLAAIYLCAYALGRFFIEMMRLDSTFISGFRLDQMMAFVVFVCGAALFFKWEAQS